MSIRLSQSEQGQFPNTKYEQSSGICSLQERIPLNYSLCSQKMKEAPIHRDHLSSFTTYQHSQVDQDKKSQPPHQQFSSFQQLKLQMGLISKDLFMAKIQSQTQLQQNEILQRLFEILKDKQNREQNEQNMDFVRKKGDIIFATGNINPLWPCQIRKIYRVPGSIPEITYSVKFITEKTVCYVNSDQIVSFTTQNCQYVKKHAQGKKLKKAIKLAVKMAQKNIERFYNQKITRQFSQSTQSNQRQNQAQKEFLTTEVVENQIVENKEGFLTVKKSLQTVPQTKKKVFMPIVITLNSSKQKIVFKESLDAKTVKLNGFRQKSVQKGKKQFIPKTIRIIGLIRQQNKGYKKTVIQFKKQTRKYVKKLSLPKNQHQNEIKHQKFRTSTPQDLKIQTPRLPLSLFQRIQKFDKKHLKKIQRNQRIHKYNCQHQKNTQQNSSFSQHDKNINQDQNSRYDEQVQNETLAKSIDLQIQYEKYSDADDEQTTLIQQFLDISQVKEDFKQQDSQDDQKQQAKSELNSNSMTQNILKQTELSKEQEKRLIKNIQSYNDELFKVRLIKDRKEVQDEIIEKLSKVGPNNLANTQIVDQLCMMTGLMKQQSSKNSQYIIFYKKVVQTIKKSVSRIGQMMKQSDNRLSGNLKMKIIVGNKLWLLTNCISSR